MLRRGGGCTLRKALAELSLMASRQVQRLARYAGSAASAAARRPRAVTQTRHRLNAWPASARGAAGGTTGVWGAADHPDSVTLQLGNDQMASKHGGVALPILIHCVTAGRLGYTGDGSSPKPQSNDDAIRPVTASTFSAPVSSDVAYASCRFASKYMLIALYRCPRE